MATAMNGPSDSPIRAPAAEAAAGVDSANGSRSVAWNGRAARPALGRAARAPACRTAAARQGRDAAAGRVEGHPAIAREVDLDPGVGVAVEDRLDGPVCGIEGAGQEALGDPGRDAQVAQEDGHRRRVVLAEAALEPGEALDRDDARAVDVAHVRVVL